VRTRLVRSGRATDALVRITSTTRVREPVVTVVLSLGCPPRIAHKFVSLLDPPAAVARPEPVKAVAPIPAVTPPPATVAELPPAPPDADERQHAREQVQALQERVERLQQAQESLQQSVSNLQARLRASEEARHDPALYGLSTLVVLLLVVIAMLLWRQARQRSDERWLQDAQALTDHGPRPSEARRMSTAPPSFDEVTASSMRVVPESSSYPSAATVPPPVVERASPTTIPAAARVRRELTAEELIDLEQQADFFIALGQEESAIDLLMGHVRSSGGTSPLPYLKLLQIYRRRGEAEPYERIRERFNRRFNAHAPHWDTDPALGRPLEDYADIVERLQRAWPVPSRSIDLLEALLFRRDPAQAGFDLPAYEELLFLYALARDLVEHESHADGVDLLLPLEIGTAAPIMHVAQGTAAGPRRADRPIDLDIDLGTGPSSAVG